MDNNFENNTLDMQGDQTDNTRTSYAGSNTGAAYTDVNTNGGQSDSDAGAAYSDPNAGVSYSDPNAGASFQASNIETDNGMNHTGAASNTPHIDGLPNTPSGQTTYTYGNFSKGPEVKSDNGASAGQSSAQNDSYGNGYNNYSNNMYDSNGWNRQGGGKQDEGMDTSPMSMGEFLTIELVFSLIPCVGIIVYLIWAFGKSGNINRRNYCRARLIVTAISLVIQIILVFIIISAFAGMASYITY